MKRKVSIILFTITSLLFFTLSPTFYFENQASESTQFSNHCLGEVFVVGVFSYSITEKEREIIEKIKPGGVVLYSRNFKNHNQFKSLMKDIRSIAGEDVFIMIDEEPAGAQRIGVFDKCFAYGIPDWDVIRQGAKTMKELRINVNLAPVLDYPFDKSTFIRKRVPVKDFANLKKFNKSFITISKEESIMSTLKHFPGMGFFNDDPHIKIPSQDIKESDFNNSLELFQDGIDAGADFVMTSHAFYSNIDEENIATFSSRITQELLINKMQFNGLVVTDDLSDMPVTDQENTHSVIAIKALKAGHHLVMYSHQLERTEKIYEEVANQLKASKELEDLFSEKCKKIKEFKKSKFNKL